MSGETIESRPKVQEVLRLVESPRYKAILIVEPQRLSRGDLEDIGRLVKLLRYSSTIVITLQYTYDLQDERDRDQFERELKRGNEFLEYQKRIMNNGRLLSVQNGNFIGQKAPYGYRKKVVREGKRKCYTLEPDPETAPVVKMIFEMYRDGLGMTRIADRLVALGIPSPDGGIWSPSTIPRFLKNEHYIGKVVWNKRPTTRTVQSGEVIIGRPVSHDYLVYEGKHDAIIDMDLWNAVQERRGTIPPSPKNKTVQNPLAGLLFCQCGKAMSRRTYKDKSGKERSSPRLCCPEQHRCGTASATLDDVLDEVVSVLQSTIADFEIRIKQETESADACMAQHRHLISKLETRLHELKELEIAQWDEKIKGEIPQHVFDRLNRDTLRQIRETEKELQDAREVVPNPAYLQERLTTFRAALDAMLSTEVPVREKNELLKSCIKRIDYSRKRVGNAGHACHGEESPIELDFTLLI